MMHLIRFVLIASNISIAIHLCAPSFIGSGQIQLFVLCRMRYRWLYVCNLRSCISIKVLTGFVVPSNSITHISCTPTIERHAPTYCSMLPTRILPNAISSNTYYLAQRIEKMIWSIHRKGIGYH